MATRTIARMYDNYADAAQVVNDLEGAGIPHSEISMVAHEGARGDVTDASHAGETTGPASGAGAGASVGTIIGGGAGLLAGIGSLALPGVGPVIAAGWLVATITGAGIGAAAGGLLGSLTGSGVSQDEAQVYAEGVRRGGTLVTVRADDEKAPTVERVMAERTPVDWRQRETDYRGTGWNKYDPKAPAYTSKEVEAERERVRSGL